MQSTGAALERQSPALSHRFPEEESAGVAAVSGTQRVDHRGDQAATAQCRLSHDGDHNSGNGATSGPIHHSTDRASTARPDDNNKARGTRSNRNGAPTGGCQSTETSVDDTCPATGATTNDECDDNQTRGNASNDGERNQSGEDGSDTDQTDLGTDTDDDD